MPPVETLLFYSAILGAIVGAVGIALTLAGRYKLQQEQRILMIQMSEALSRVEKIQAGVSKLEELRNQLSETPGAGTRRRLEAAGEQYIIDNINAAFDTTYGAIAQIERSLSANEKNGLQIKAAMEDYLKRIVVVTDTLKARLQFILDYTRNI